VVAISIGAHIAAALASQYPSRLRSLTVSGFNLFAPAVFSPLLPPLVYLVQRGSGFIQKPAAEWQHFCQGRRSLSAARDIFNILFSSRELQPIAVRTLVIAATSQVLVADNLDHSRRLFHTVVPDNGSQAVQHRQMRHPWNADEPVLFAKMVMCWIRGESLPTGFEDIVGSAV
jgi:pimeloyl-ACP methyl ester carboxylesterase